jgi:hypothetical protein
MAVTGAGRRYGYGLVQAGEPGDDLVKADQGEDAEDGAANGDDHAQLAAFGQRAPVRSDQDARPR